MRKNNIGNIFKIGFLYLSTIIGAGFATGREIKVYFTNYGISGYIGMAISTVLLIFAGCAICIIAYVNGTDTVSGFNELIAGKYAGKAVTYVITSFSYSLYVIILAGLADLCKRNFGIDKIYTVLLVTVVSLIVHICGFKVLAYICALSAPVITVCVFIAAGMTLNPDFFPNRISLLPMSVFSAVLYAGYNSLVAVSIMARATRFIDSKKTAVAGVVIGTLAIMSCGLLVNLSLTGSYEKIKYSDMPLLTLIQLHPGKWENILFLCMLFGTMLTSAISGLSSVLHVTGKKIGAVSVVASIPLSFAGFGKLMDILYPLYGFAGIFVLVMLVLSLKISYNNKILIKDDWCGRKKENRYQYRKTKKNNKEKALCHTGSGSADCGIASRGVCNGSV